MKWFDKTEIKDKESLTGEEIAYLLKPSLATLAPFNCILRKHFDNVLAFIILVVGYVLLNQSDDIGPLSALFLLLNTALLGWCFYFFTKHGRRLAWNRNQWKDIESFKKSETKWESVAVVFTALQIFKEVRESTDSEALIYEGIGFLFFACTVILPYVQAWRMKRRDQQREQVAE